MKSNDFSDKKEQSFLSLRVKMLGGYVLVLMIVMFLISYFLPSIINNYLLSEKKNDLEKTRSIIAEVLEESVFRDNPDAENVLEAVAEAQEINIWICTPVRENSVRLHEYGGTANSVRNLDFNSLTDGEKALKSKLRTLFAVPCS